MPSSAVRPSGGARAVLLAGATGLAALATWTYLPAARLWPWGDDAVKWAGEADPANPGWARWVFGSRHFIGWRPVTALSFTLNALWGDSPVAMHAVDYAAMAATLVLVGVVGAQLYAADRRGPLTRWGEGAVVASALLAVALVALHPVIQEVVPYTARRSYDLGAMFGLAGLALWLRELATGRDRWVSGWIVGATLLLGLSFGSNEASFPIATVLPLLALHARWPDRERLGSALRPVALPLVPAVGLAIGRSLVLADDFSTGYVKKWFAYAEGGHNRLRVMHTFEPLSVLRAAWTYVMFPSSGTGDDSLLWAGGAGTVVAAGLLAWLCWSALARPVLRRSDPVGRRPLPLLAWAGVTAALYAVANTWFWREGFPLLLPFALTVGAVAHAALVRWEEEGRGLPSAPDLLAIAALTVSIGWWSPVLRGWDMAPLTEERIATGMMEDLVARLGELPPRAVVWLVVPGDQGFATDVSRAVQRLRRPETQRFRVLAYVSRSDVAGADDLVARVGTTPEGPTLELNPEAHWDPAARGVVRTGAARSMLLARLPGVAARSTQVWWWDGPGFDTLHRVTRDGEVLPP